MSVEVAIDARMALPRRDTTTENAVTWLDNRSAVPHCVVDQAGPLPLASGRTDSILTQRQAEPQGGTNSAFSATCGGLALNAWAVESGKTVSRCERDVRDPARYTAGVMAISQTACGRLVSVLVLLLPVLPAQATAAAAQRPRTEEATTRVAPARPEAAGRLIEAAMLGDLTQVKAALTDGANANALADGHMTVLGVASLYGRTEVVKTLVAGGADVSADQGGETVLMLAASEGHTPTVEALIG